MKNVDPIHSSEPVTGCVCVRVTWIECVIELHTEDGQFYAPRSVVQLPSV